MVRDRGSLLDEGFDVDDDGDQAGEVETRDQAWTCGSCGTSESG